MAFPTGNHCNTGNKSVKKNKPPNKRGLNWVRCQSNPIPIIKLKSNRGAIRKMAGSIPSALGG